MLKMHEVYVKYMLLQQKTCGTTKMVYKNRRALACTLSQCKFPVAIEFCHEYCRAQQFTMSCSLDYISTF